MRYILLVFFLKLIILRVKNKHLIQRSHAKGRRNYAKQEETFETSYELSMALRNENDPYCENTNANDMQTWEFQNIQVLGKLLIKLLVNTIINQ